MNQGNTAPQLKGGDRSALLLTRCQFNFRAINGIPLLKLQAHKRAGKLSFLQVLKSSWQFAQSPSFSRTSSYLNSIETRENRQNLNHFFINETKMKCFMKNGYLKRRTSQMNLSRLNSFFEDVACFYDGKYFWRSYLVSLATIQEVPPLSVYYIFVCF